MAFDYGNPRTCGIFFFDCTEPAGDGAAGSKPRSTSWMPLLSCSVHVSICNNSTRVTLKQTFSNHTGPIPEAAYTLPLYEGASVVAFTCTIGDLSIHGVVKEKDKARKMYEVAKKKGSNAGLLVQNSPDVWSTKIGNIPAAGKVEVEISYLCELKHDSEVDGIRFVLPISIAPRYGDAPLGLPSSGVQNHIEQLEIVVAVTMTSPITTVQSSSHPISVGIGTLSPNLTRSKNQFDHCKAHATLSQKGSSGLDKDFVLLIVSEDMGSPQAIVETHPSLPKKHSAMMLTLVPKFEVPRIKPEIVFVADRSGSMEENIPQLRSALTVFLKSLPVGVKFNICSFGHEFSFLWPKSRPYNQESLDLALKHVQEFQADLGGTELCKPLEATLKNRFNDLQTEILVLTDGEIWDQQTLFDLVQEGCKGGDVRVFSLGIGDDVSHALVEGLARSGKGYAQIVGKNDKLDAKVVRMLKAALTVHIKNYHLRFAGDEMNPSTPTDNVDSSEDFVKLEKEDLDISEKMDGGGEDSKKDKNTISLFDSSANPDKKNEMKDRFSHLPPFTPPKILQTPFEIPPLYPFNRTTVYLLLSSLETPASVTLRGTTWSGDELKLEIPVTNVGEGTTLHQLGAKKLIQELEEGHSYLHSGKFGVDPKKNEGTFGDWIEREAVRVGTTFGVAGKWTSFVAVENVHADDVDDSYDYMGVPNVEAKLYTFSVDDDDADNTTENQAPVAYKLVSKRAVGGMSLMMQSVPAMPCSFGGAFGTQLDSFAGAGPVACSGNVAPEVEESSPLSVVLSEVEKKTYELVRLQTFDGSFEAGVGDWEAIWKEFSGWLANGTQSEQQAKSELHGLDEPLCKKLIATAIAVCTFEQQLKDTKSVWEMVEEKASEWGVSVVGLETWSVLKKWTAAQLDSS